MSKSLATPYILALATMLLISPNQAAAQATAVAQINGIVTDQTGATVAGATVRAQQTQTGLVRTAITGSDGGYVLPALPVGPYIVHATAAGFKEYIREGVLLQVNQKIRLDVPLAVGTASESVNVSAAADMIQLTSNSESTVIEQGRIEDLPLNGRNPTQLIFLSGAAVAPPLGDFATSKNYPTSTPIILAGGQETGTYYLLDGGEHFDFYTNINLPVPFPDVLQEFSVETSNVPAEYGGHPGGVVNSVTKSGTNAFHGDAFEFVRNYITNAANYFATAKDTLKRNQFGGTIGGPILKSKLFFFGGFQETLTRTAPPTSTFFVPTAAVLAGDFSTIFSSACGSPKTILDPATGKALPGNKINPARFDQSALSVLKLIPVSTDPCGKLQESIPNPSNEYQADGRVDWAQSTRNSFFGRYFSADYQNPGAYDGKNILLTTRAGVLDFVQTGVLGDTFTISPHLLNAFHLAGSRFRIARGGVSNVPTANDFGLKIASVPGNLPFMSVSGYFTVSCGTCSKSQLLQNMMQAADDVNWSPGRHQFGFGIDLIRHQDNYLIGTALGSQYFWNGQGGTGVAISDFLLGLPSQFLSGNPDTYNAREWNLGLYAQDTFRPNSKLTLNFGFRWQPYLPMFDGGRVTYFDLGAASAGQMSSRFQNSPPGMFFAGDRLPDGSTLPDTGVGDRFTNYEPRVGISWDPTGTGVWGIRASYGMFHDLPPMHYLDRWSLGPPWGTTITVLNPSGGFANPFLQLGGNPFPQPTPPPANIYFPPGGQYINVPLQIHTPNTQQWNLSIQRQLGGNTLLTASYIGNQSVHRWVNVQENPSTYIAGTCGGSACSTTANSVARSVISKANPTAGALISSLLGVVDSGNAKYNALYLAVNHRMANNFSVLANYTWSHCMSDSNLIAEAVGSGVQNPNLPVSAERANCNSDVRQIFNTSLLVTSPKFQNNEAFGAVARGWILGGLITAQTGMWNTPTSGIDASLTNVGADRPNIVASPAISGPSAAKWFNTAAYKLNGPGTYGNARPFSLEGPGAFRFDAMLNRRFKITEAQNVELRVECFNVLNHPVLNNPITTYTSPSFGKVLTANDPRIWQFALKYFF